MRHEVEISKAGKLYAAAYAAQYSSKNIYKAFTLYKSVIAAFPQSKEAGNAKLQIRNIVDNLLPKDPFLREQINSASVMVDSEK